MNQICSEQNTKTSFSLTDSFASANLPQGKMASTFKVETYEDISKTSVALRIALTERAFPLYLKAFLLDSSPSIEKDEKTNALRIKDMFEHISGADRVTLHSQGEEIIAMVISSSKSFKGEKVFHLQGILIDPCMQGKGIGKAIMQKELLSTGSQILAFHTQSAVMLELGGKLADLCCELAQDIAPIIGTRHQEACVDKGRYDGKCLYGDIQAFSKLAIRSISYDKGDALICAGYIRKEILNNEI